MSDAGDDSNSQSPLDYTGYLAMAWTVTGANLVLSVGRYYIRLKTFRKLAWDDAAHALALTTQIIYTALYSTMFPYSNALELAGLGIGPEPSMADLDKFYHLFIPVLMFFWVVTYSVKLTFMLFYRQIFGVSERFLRAWWAVSGFLIVSFLASMLTGLWSCGYPGVLYVIPQCVSDNAQTVVDNFAIFCVALNITGDLAIMALPLWMLKGLQVKKGQKAGLAVLFSLGMVIIAFDLVRAITGVGGGTTSLASLWETLEPAVAVLVATLPTYRLLLQTPRERHATSYRTLGPSKASSRFTPTTDRSYELGQRNTTGSNTELTEASRERSADIRDEISQTSNKL